MGVVGGNRGEGAAMLPHPGQRPLANPGTFVAGAQTRTFWPSRGSVVWLRIRSPTSVSSWPR